MAVGRAAANGAAPETRRWSRGGDKTKYLGKGVLRAVDNVNALTDFAAWMLDWR